MNDCIFCKIVSGEIPAQIIHEDELTLAFLDIRPVNPGHILVIPKQDVDQFQDLDEKTYQAVMASVYKMAKLLKEKLDPVRVGVVVYGFDVPHVHVHVIPMDQPGAIKLDHSPGQADNKELEAIKQKLTN